MQAIYKCVSTRCRARDREVRALTPAEHRLAVGGPVRCGRCGDVLVWLRPVDPEPEAAPTWSGRPNATAPGSERHTERLAGAE